MDDIRLTSLPTVNKPDCSPMNTNRIRLDSETVIQQSDVSSSRPALLAHDALGPLLFEVGSHFHSFTIADRIDMDSHKSLLQSSVRAYIFSRCQLVRITKDRTREKKKPKERMQTNSLSINECH